MFLTSFFCFNNREVGQKYRSVGRLRVRCRQSGQAGGLRVRTGKGQNQESEKKRDWEKQELRTKTLVVSTNKTNWHLISREHRYKHTGDNGEDG
jgi:hypothetical protein